MARNKHPEVTVNRIIDAAMELFIAKGYDNTTIQDIINALGDLSKGAIYHHFKSKEEIFLAIDKRYEGIMYDMLAEVRAHTELNGLEKLRMLMRNNISDPHQQIMLRALPNFADNPRFLKMQLHACIGEIAPHFLEPLIREGIADGSIQAEDPKELSEVLVLLLNIWVNPLIWHSDAQTTRSRILYIKKLTDLLGVPVLDDEMIATADWMLEL